MIRKTVNKTESGRESRYLVRWVIYGEVYSGNDLRKRCSKWRGSVTYDDSEIRRAQRVVRKGKCSCVEFVLHSRSFLLCDQTTKCWLRITLRHIRALRGLWMTKNRSDATRAAIHVLEKRNRLCSGMLHTLYRYLISLLTPGVSTAAGMPTIQNSRSDIDSAVSPTSDERSEGFGRHGPASRPCICPARCDVADDRNTPGDSRWRRAIVSRRRTTTLPTAPSARTVGMTTWLTQ